MQPRATRTRRLGLAAFTAVLCAACSQISQSEPEPTVVTLAPTVDPTTTTSPTTVVEAPTSTESTTTSTAVTLPPDGIAAALIPEVVNRYPHDPTAFTQGLERRGNALLEGVGEYAKSSRRLVEPTTGRVITEVPLPLQVFGTGLTVVGDDVVQLTWQSETAYVASADALTETGQFDYQGEGWGLCAEPDRLVMSNGSSELTFRDPATFAETGRVTVTLNGEPVVRLNELECVNGTVWANVWLTSTILQIDPATGAVVAVVDASSLIPTDQALGREDVLNGIAYNADTDTYYVTGKRWNVLYEVRFTPVG